ncbi:hypothetical protein RBH94_08365 [Aestuariibaculum sp. YM273]|uniref:hypothetical protein n=1 Tax=Aestuariibaculum sp. YM273 TaxID=3070659 RepID=UPI0027DB2F3E|nr:hypothetical protein [Aestuariibaculum sp. YM273]WMI64083.1 hypothetical protein RBH94_08365 [Aestuariibaculum sp. YM273]
MKSKYFGVINETEFLDWESDIQEEYLIKNDLFEAFSVFGLNPQPDEVELGRFKDLKKVDNFIREMYPKDDVLNDFYQFILEIYRAGIDGDYISFSIGFDNLTFQKSQKEKRVFALKEFERIFDEICPMEYRYFVKNDSGSGLTFGLDRFKSLHRTQEYIIINLRSEAELILPFLLGDRQFFNRELYSTNEVILKICNFEKGLKILIALNEEFQFEKDTVFCPKSLAELLFDAYEGNVSKEVVKFIDQSILEVDEKIPSFVCSLMMFLNQKQLLNLKEEVFRSGINQVYDLKLSKIKLSNPSNKKHEERIAYYEEKWKGFL